MKYLFKDFSPRVAVKVPALALDRISLGPTIFILLEVGTKAAPLCKDIPHPLPRAKLVAEYERRPIFSLSHDGKPKLVYII